MRRYFVQERGKKRRHSRATASIFNEVIGLKSEQIQAIYFVTTPTGVGLKVVVVATNKLNTIRLPDHPVQAGSRCQPEQLTTTRR